MLINCVAYQNGKKLGDIPIDDISEYVKRPDCFVWVALFEPATGRARRDGGGVRPARARRRGRAAAATSGRRSRSTATRCSSSCTRSSCDTGQRAPRRRGRHLRRSATTSSRSAIGRRRGFADVRARSEREPELLRHGSGFVLYALMDTVVDRYFPVLDALEIGARADRGADLRARRRAPQHRGALRAEAEAHGAASTPSTR